MINKYALTGIAWLLSISATAYYVRDYVIAKHDQAVLEAVNIAIEQERAKQNEVARIEQKKYTALQGVNNRLNVDLDLMRKRAGRLSEAARAECKGATGSELSDRDAAAFVRLGARAEQCRIGLTACYEYADSLQ